MDRKILSELKWGIVIILVDFNIGRFNLLPDFLGYLLFGMAVKEWKKEQPDLGRLKPFLWILGIESMIQWVFPFYNGLVQLVVTAVSCYTVYVLLGAAAGQLESRHPDQAGGLERLRIGVIALQVVYFFAGGYGNGTVLTILAAAMILLVIGILLNLHSVEAAERVQE